MGRAGRAGPIKLGQRPGSGRAYKPVDSQRAGPDRILIFFKARGQPTGFMLGGHDGPDGPRDDGPNEPRMTGLIDPE